MKFTVYKFLWNTGQFLLALNQSCESRVENFLRFEKNGEFEASTSCARDQKLQQSLGQSKGHWSNKNPAS